MPTAALNHCGTFNAFSFVVVSEPFVFTMWIFDFDWYRVMIDKNIWQRISESCSGKYSMKLTHSEGTTNENSWICSNFQSIVFQWIRALQYFCLCPFIVQFDFFRDSLEFGHIHELLTQLSVEANANNLIYFRNWSTIAYSFKCFSS